MGTKKYHESDNFEDQPCYGSEPEQGAYDWYTNFLYRFGFDDLLESMRPPKKERSKKKVKFTRTYTESIEVEDNSN